MKQSPCCSAAMFVLVALLFVGGGFSPPAHAGLSQPPVLIFGQLETFEGIPIMTGALVFQMIPVSGGPVVTVPAQFDELADNANFLVRIPVETPPVANSANTLNQQGQYTVTVSYNGESLDTPGVPDPFTPVSDSLVGPVLLRLSPTGPVLEISDDIVFGRVPIGEYLDGILTVTNRGIGTLTGTAEAKLREHFRLVEGGFTVPTVGFNLAAGESAHITVRFQPVTPGPQLEDTIEFLTNVGQEDRYLSGVGFAVTPTPTGQPTTTPTPWPTSTRRPTETPTPWPTPTIEPTGIGLIAVDVFAGLHPAPQDRVQVNISCFDGYYYPFGIVRDAAKVSGEEAIHVVDGFGHVFTYTIGDVCFEQIPNERQVFFYPEDVAVAVVPRGVAGAYVLIDTGEIFPVGDAPSSIPSVVPGLPYRDGTPDNPMGDPANRGFEIPGPRKGPWPIGTIAETGGWNEWSAIDFDLTGADGAIVLSRNGMVHKVGSAAALQFGSHSPWLWPDLARKIRYLRVEGQDYYVVLDGLGGMHMAGPDGALRASFQNNVLGANPTYFAAVVQGNYVGLDAANDFIPIVHSGGSEIGIIMLDGLGGIHVTNVPYPVEPTAYLPTEVTLLDTMVSLLRIDPRP